MPLLVASLLTCSSVSSVWFFNEISNSLHLLAFENKIAQKRYRYTYTYFILGVLFSDSILAWQADPMVINLAETGLPVRNLDFPAVTGRIF